jgi:hypothetical protein
VLGSPGPGSFEHGHKVDSTLRQEGRSRTHNGVSLEIPTASKELL